MAELIEDIHYYFEGGLLVFTPKYHLERGHCCGSGCRHCPYEPRWQRGTTRVADETDLKFTRDYSVNPAQPQ